MTTTKPLSVAEVTELPSDSWVNGGFTAIVRGIERKVSKQNKPFWKCKLSDTTGSASLGCTMFTAPKFNEGDQVDFLGQGIKYKNDKYGPEVSVGDKTEVHLVGKAVQHEGQRPHSDTEAAAQGLHVEGQTVGMALKEAVALVQKTGLALNSPEFWSQVHVTASDIIRVSQLLQKGKLAAPVRERTAPPANPQPVREKPKPGPNGSVATPYDDGEDVPF